MVLQFPGFAPGLYDSAPTGLRRFPTPSLARAAWAVAGCGQARSRLNEFVDDPIPCHAHMQPACGGPLCRPFELNN